MARKVRGTEKRGVNGQCSKSTSLSFILQLSKLCQARCLQLHLLGGRPRERQPTGSWGRLSERGCVNAMGRRTEVLTCRKKMISFNSLARIFFPNEQTSQMCKKEKENKERVEKALRKKVTSPKTKKKKKWRSHFFWKSREVMGS